MCRWVSCIIAFLAVFASAAQSSFRAEDQLRDDIFYTEKKVEEWEWRFVMFWDQGRKRAKIAQLQSTLEALYAKSPDARPETKTR